MLVLVLEAKSVRRLWRSLWLLSMVVCAGLLEDEEMDLVNAMKGKSEGSQNE